MSPALYKRLTTGLGGYSIAMVACLALAGLVVLLTPRSHKEVLPTADYTYDLRALRSAGAYTAYGPEGLPARWRPTSSRLTGADGHGPLAWHVGFVTPKEEYAALEESDESAEPFIKRMTNRDRPVGSRQVAGAGWAQYFRPDKKQRSLVRRLKGVTLVVTGTASYDELAVLAGSLRPQPKSATTAVPSHG
ncbi:MAG: hypothetical protein JWO67_3886 [Streptosporangiaceae bacterium]|nr:hypothetical protein [Streptosporangiaceae bacterium]